MTDPDLHSVEIETVVRVSTVELFFDLVFVFTVTALTSVLAAHTTWIGFLRVSLMLGVTWWMYGGYAWLTNVVAPVSPLRRGLLVVGMSGFLTMALAIPHAFADTGWAFGCGYFVVNLVHTGLFRISGGPGSGRALRVLAPINLLSATLVLSGGCAPVSWRYQLWGAALFIQIATPFLAPVGRFTISASHFVERHGLVMIVALGESVVAIGVGAAGLRLDAPLVAVAVGGLVLAYFLYWAYFGGDEERAEHTLAAIPDPRRRARVALYGYGYAHFPMLLGIVALAAGVKKEIGHAFGHVSLAQALALGGGVALFLAGDIVFRRILRLGHSGYRVIALVGALASIPIGPVLAAGQLAVLVLVLVVPLSTEGYRRLARARAEGAD